MYTEAVHNFFKLITKIDLKYRLQLPPSLFPIHGQFVERFICSISTYQNSVCAENLKLLISCFNILFPPKEVAKVDDVQILGAIIGNNSCSFRYVWD